MTQCTHFEGARAPVPRVRPPFRRSRLAVLAEMIHHNDPLVALVPILRHLQPRDFLSIRGELDRRDRTVLVRRDLVGLDMVIPRRRAGQRQDVHIFTGVACKVQVRRLDSECDVVF